jgi:hypothetical protein
MRKLLLFFLITMSLLACKNTTGQKEKSVYDLPQIKDSGELVVLTLYSSTSYFYIPRTRDGISIRTK